MGTYTIQQCLDAIVPVQTAKANIATAITNKGGTVAAGATLADMPTAIGTIPTGITPTGSISISSNGIYDVTNYASANVNVGGTAWVAPDGTRFNSSTFSTLPFFDASNITDATNMFASCYELTTIPLLDTSNVTNMDGMVRYCSSLTTIPALDTSNVTNMQDMFRFCSSLTTIPALDTSNVTNMSRMFYNCSEITTIPALDTSNVTNMSRMFYNCSEITTISGLNLSSLSSSTEMFGSSGVTCPNLTHFILTSGSSINNSWTSLNALTAIDYDSVKSILTAASNTTNSNAKTLTFNRTMSDPDGELAALVADCTSASKNWTITGLTLS